MAHPSGPTPPPPDLSPSPTASPVTPPVVQGHPSTVWVTTDITITVIDGEPLTDILNRVYALGRLTGQHDAFLENLEQRANQIILGK